MTPEGRVKELVKKLFKKFEVYYHMPVQNGMGNPTLDFVACPWGYYLTVETKAPGKKPTPRQEITIAQVEASGGFTFVVSDDASLARLECYLELMRASWQKKSCALPSPAGEITTTTTTSSARSRKSRPSSTSS